MVNSIERQQFGHLPDGGDVGAVVLRNANGLSAKILTYGATLAALEVPDRDGRSRNVVLGFETLGDYRQARGHLGGVIGRYANRLRNGRFTLDGRDVQVSVNEPPNTLHGGAQGFDRAVWQIEVLQSDPVPAVTLAHVSPDSDQGFPGRLDVRVRYTLEANALRLDYTATTDLTTVINLTNHSYFNLRGGGSGDVLDHELLIAADAVTPIDRQLIPSGALRPVAGTPFDFTTPTTIGARIAVADEQLVLARGYDHNYVLRSGGGKDPGFAARVREPRSGLTMEVWTTEPGVQFYSGNFLDGRPYRARDGFCLETQHFPDSPNRPDFPSTVLRPGDVFRSATLFRFSAS